VYVCCVLLYTCIVVDALLRAVVSGNPKFFSVSDSAPHPQEAKRGWEDGWGKTAAGVFTQGYATRPVLDAVEAGLDRGVMDDSEVTMEKLRGDLGGSWTCVS